MGKSGVQKGMRCSPQKVQPKIKITHSLAKTREERARDQSLAEKLREHQTVYNLAPTYDHEEKNKETCDLVTKNKKIVNRFLTETKRKRIEHMAETKEFVEDQNNVFVST
jgi:hypothetical protein